MYMTKSALIAFILRGLSRANLDVYVHRQKALWSLLFFLVVKSELRYTSLSYVLSSIKNTGCLIDSTLRLRSCSIESTSMKTSHVAVNALSLRYSQPI